nr:gliding motility-associated C-terminal domain-containing protein [Saprospiraceae bacterium]
MALPETSISSIFLKKVLLLFLGLIVVNALSSQVQLVVENGQPLCGTIFTVEIYVNDFDDIDEFQFTIEFDAGALNFDGYDDLMPSGNTTIGTAMAAQGILTFEWSNTSPLSLADGTVILTIDFEHIGNCEDYFIVHIIDDPLAFTASGTSGIQTPLVFGGVFILEDGCPLEVDAGEDQTICDGGEVLLSGSVVGQAYDHSWEPANLVNSPEQLSTLATVNEETVFTLTSRAITHNIVYNTHLDYGYAGFYSDYEYDPNDISQGNGIAVANSPDIVYSNFPLCTDHTGNNGNMVVVNGIGSPPQNVWCQYIEVQEDTEYHLEAFTDILVPFLNPASLQFFINGNAVGGTFEPSGIPCIGNWTEMEATWFSGSTTSIELCIYNHTGNVGTGNAFILDDIAMYPLCEVEDTVTVFVEETAEEWLNAVICQDGDGIIVDGEEYNEPGFYTVEIERQGACDSIVYLDLEVVEFEVLIESPATLTCIQEEVVLDASGSSSGAYIQYIWSSTDGNFTQNEDSSVAVVNEPGTYTLQLIYDDSEVICFSEEVSVVVAQDTAKPNVVISGPSEIDCSGDEWVIQAEVSPPGIIDFNWSTTDGNIIGSINQSEIIVDQPGYYLLEVTNTLNGCVGVDGFELEESTDLPHSDAGEDLIWTCADSILFLDGSSSDQGSDFSFQWTVLSGGSIVSSADSIAVEINGPGVYLLEVFNSKNNCSSADTVWVEEINDLPELVGSQEEKITCEAPAVWVGFDLFPDTILADLQWATADGDILSSPDSLFIQVGTTGTYVLDIYYPENGCTATGEIYISENTHTPEANAGEDREIDCDSPSVQLDGTQSSMGDTLSYWWLTSWGNIIDGADGLTPNVSQGGEYILRVLNETNGCFALDTVWVRAVGDYPVIQFFGDSVLNCNQKELLIETSVLPDSLSPIYQWTTSGGNIIGSTDSSFTTLDSAGIYTLEVTFSENNCTSISNWVVSSDFNIPEIILIDSAEINCHMETAPIVAETSIPSDQINVTWEGPPGGIVGEDSSKAIEAGVGGYYIVLLENLLNGCSNNDSVWVGENFGVPDIVIDQEGILDCVNDSVILIPQVSPDGFDLEFMWQTSGGEILSDIEAESISVGAEGMYYLQVTNLDNHCVITDSIFVPNIADLPIANAGPDKVLNCRDSLIQLDGSMSGQDANTEYFWETSEEFIVEGATTTAPLVSEAGSYTLTVINLVNGCTNTDEVQVLIDTMPPAYSLLGLDELSCLVTYLELFLQSEDLTSIEFGWINESGESLETTDESSVIISEPGSYQLTIENTNNYCTSKESVFVGLDTIAPHSEMECVDCEDCITFPVVLDGSGSSSSSDDYSLEWLGQGDWEIISDELVQVLSAGTYSLVVTDNNNGCRDTSVLALEEAFPDLPLYSVENIDCNRRFGSIVFGEGAGGLMYSIDGGIHFSSDNVFENLETDVYELVVRDSLNCLSDPNAVLIEDHRESIEIDLPAEIILSPGEIFQLDPQFSPPDFDGLSYLWSPAQYLDCADCPNPVIQAIEDETVIFLEVESTGGCTGHTEILVKLKLPELSVYIPTAFSPNQDGINDRLTIYASDGVDRIQSIAVFDRWGNRVFENINFPPNDPRYGWDGTFQGRNSMPGLYVVRVEVENPEGEIRLFTGEVILIR